ncbi:MAG: adenylate/guanylate cyclase domain-containing protein [Archangium sp.]
MRAFLSRRRYEFLALVTFVFFAFIHTQTSYPLMGGVKSTGNAGHRFVQNLDGRVANLLFRIRGARPSHPDVVVLEIDERGAQRFGLWPWPREVMAEVIDKLLDADVKVVALDMAFTDKTSLDMDQERAWLRTIEAVPTPSEELLGVKRALEARLANSPDERLEAVFRKGGARVVQGTVPFQESDAEQVSPEQRAAWAKILIDSGSAMQSGQNGKFTLSYEKVRAYNGFVGVNAPLARFTGLGNPLGHFATVPDADSTIRRAPLLVRLDEPKSLFPSISLQAAAQQLNAKIAPVLENNELRGITLQRAEGNVDVPVEAESYFTLINYPGDRSAFHRVSAVDVLDGKVGKAELAGKAVLVGVTIVGSTGDQRVTPFSEFEAGVFTHASVLSNMLSRDFLARPDTLNFLEWGLMAVLGLIIAVVTPRIRSFVGKILLLSGTLLLFAAITYVLFARGLKMSAVVPALHLVTTAFGTIFLGYLSVDREKLKMRSTFSRYLGEDVMDVALENPDKLNRGEKREMTVLFSDIRGFTSLSEHMSPEKLAEFINQYLSPMTQIVFDEKGTLDKYIGDAVMAFWNAPLDQPDHAMRACRAAVHMLERLEELKKTWRTAGYPELEIGIGINTGQMVVGNMGSDVRVDYTVLGDSVNLGSRLEGTNKEYETRTIISEWTYAAVKDSVVARRLGAVRVKGKKVPVGIFELRGLGQASGDEAKAIALFEQALVASTARKFDEARALLEQVLTLWPNDGPTRNYLAELDEFRTNPPPADWDGVVSLKTK